MRNFVLTFSLTVVIFGLLSTGLNLRARKLILQARETRKEVSATSNKIVALVETKDQLEAAQPKIDKLSQALPTQNQAIQIVQTLMRTHTIDAAITPLSGSDSKPANGELTISIEGTAPTLAQTQAFIQDIEQQTAIFTVKRLVLTNTSFALSLGVFVNETH